MGLGGGGGPGVGGTVGERGRNSNYSFVPNIIKLT